MEMLMACPVCGQSPTVWDATYKGARGFEVSCAYHTKATTPPGERWMYRWVFSEDRAAAVDGWNHQTAELIREIIRQRRDFHAD